MQITIHRVVGWHTTKTQIGNYRWAVTSADYQVPTNTLVSGVCATRDQATGKAKKWAVYYRRMAACIYATAT